LRSDNVTNPAASDRSAVDRAQLEAFAADVRTGYLRELRRSQELQESYLATIRVLAAAVEAKDARTGGHIQRVHALGLLLAEVIIPEQTGDAQLSCGFLLHDVGKLAVPDAVLNKPAELNEAEWVLMRRHPTEGARILSPVPFLDRALDVVRHHHERWDGTGYPAGLRGEEIPLWARIFAVVDAVDAITSERPYRAARPLSAALEELAAGSGTQFDPDCVEAFLGLDEDDVEALLQDEDEPLPGLDSIAMPEFFLESR
jgi:ribonuclease P protein subunit RPR2